MTCRVLLMISSMRGGGSEQQTLLLLRHLDRSLFTPHLYLMERAGDLMSRIPDDVTVHAFADMERKPGIYFPGHVMRQQVHHLRDLLKNQSIDVVYDRTFHMTMIAGPASRACGVPRLSTIVSPPDQALPMVETRFVNLKRRRLSRAYRESSRTIAVSQIAASSAESYYSLAPGTVQVVPNPVDIAAVCTASQESEIPKSGLPGRSDRLTLACVGRMTREKGQADLIEAIAVAQSKWPKGAPSLRILMVGDGPLRNELELQSHRVGQPHHVEFVGISRNTASILATADALVLPSHFEGMPNVVLEAMALQIPIIATRAGGTVELERDEPTILWAEPGDPRSLAQAIQQFATDPDAAQDRVDAATRLIHRYHNVKQTVGSIESYLQEAVTS